MQRADGVNLDIVETGLLDTVDIDGGHVAVRMRLTTLACHMVSYFVREVEERVGDLPGVDSVELETDLGMEWTEDMMSDAARARREELFAREAAKYEEELGPPDRWKQRGSNRRGES